MIIKKMERYAIMRKNRSEVWAGVRTLSFIPIDLLGLRPVKTYKSPTAAVAGCTSWQRDFEVVQVVETVEVVEDTK